MAFLINSPGPITILQTTSSGFGDFYRIHPKMGKLTFQVLHESSGVAGTTVQSTAIIQASNDGTNPLLTTSGSTASALGTVVLNGGSPQSDGFAIDASWGFVRAGLLSAPSTGRVKVIVSGQWRS